MSEIGPLLGQERLNKAADLRIAAARKEATQMVVSHPSNSDELLPNKAGNYSKGLGHNGLGEVDAVAYSALLKAVKSGDPNDYPSFITLGRGK